MEYSATGEIFDQEINRIKQILVNNDYPLYIIDRTITRVLNQQRKNQPDNLPQKIELFIELFNLTTLRRDRALLTRILNEHINVIKPNHDLQIRCFFKPKKLSSLFSTRCRPLPLRTSNVVYSFECPEENCQSSYIGYTTCELCRRCAQHRAKQSSINKHIVNFHGLQLPDSQSFCDKFSIIARYNDPTKLKLAEAILIRKRKPIINVQSGEISNFLNLYK